ncbi:MAG: LPXTG cell wall anchor domain-containing protein [Acidobacteriota bacterium]
MESTMIVRVVALGLAVLVVGIIILRRRKQKSA